MKALLEINEAIYTQELGVRDDMIAQLQHQTGQLQEQLAAQTTQIDTQKDSTAAVGDSSRVHTDTEQKMAHMTTKLTYLSNQVSAKTTEIEELKKYTAGLENTINDLNYQKLLSHSQSDTNRLTDNQYSSSQPSSSNSNTESTEDGESRYQLLQNDYDQTKHLLKERTSQLKILMSTFDALQLSGLGLSITNNTNLSSQSQSAVVSSQQSVSQSSSTPVSGGGGSSKNLLNQLAHTTLPAPLMESTWGVQSLVKRVVEVTSELASMSAELALEERRANQLVSSLIYIYVYTIYIIQSLYVYLI